MLASSFFDSLIRGKGLHEEQQQKKENKDFRRPEKG